MAKPIVLIAEELSPATLEALGPDFTVTNVDGTDRDALLKAVVEADALLVRSATQVDAEVLAVAKNLKVVARAGVGLDNVDVKAATTAGVMVVNAPTSNITSAAELAVGLLLASARHIVPANLALKNGKWARSKFTGVEINDKVVGVVGLGRIGMLVAQRLAPFGVQLIAYDPYVQPARAAQLGIKMVSLDELLAQSDFITVHLPKTAETVGLIGEDALQKVKPSVIIINAARGGIVDELALARALEEKRVAGAGLDVYAKEPCTDSPLFAFDNVVATPHLGASTDEAQEKAGIAVAKSVRLALSGELVPDAVNVQGGVLAPSVKPYLALAEHLGVIAAMLAPNPVARVSVEISGELSQEDVRVLELSALKGVFGALMNDPVSYVNAPLIAKERGVETKLTKKPENEDYRSLLRIKLDTMGGQRVTVGGTVAGPRKIEKLAEINGAEIDVQIGTHHAFYSYADRPGVIGVIGRLLGEAGVNIDNMQVGLLPNSTQAIMVLSLDQEVAPAVNARVANEVGTELAKVVSLAE